ncbi:MAG: hypothetical protein Sylvanvirus7_27 [Sylvanvirus sp.]|uniref:Uncharacterized protein n=1 Tax=Sylvanvirus sp. TaxID=2487774 RepID=A0A3G5AL97_9VIRU|nr:MAG: hypothetical protein Sylvanvirus7_27 [Sylvanvirus sp.]
MSLGYDYGLPDYSQPSIQPYRGIHSSEGTISHPVTIHEAQEWFKGLQRGLGGAVIHKAEGDEEAVRHYLASLKKLDVALAALFQRLPRDEIRYGVGLLRSKLKVLEDHANDDFGEEQDQDIQSLRNAPPNLYDLRDPTTLQSFQTYRGSPSMSAEPSQFNLNTPGSSSPPSFSMSQIPGGVPGSRPYTRSYGTGTNHYRYTNRY